ncbi:MAG: repressor LexA [Ectothiorhodospiraceae bacterium]|nr:repressor LexA [Chromatiales bacterium]MCP5155432.1 repressor LexA [Ectothiorhodospiraceae bacterium]
MPLTRRQSEILGHLRELAREGAAPSSLDALCHSLGLRSRGSLHKHVRALLDAGLVTPGPDGQGLVPVPEACTPPPGTLPLLGRIAAGRPIEAIADSRHVEVPAALRSRRACYVLEVRGDSMRDAAILDGDLVVVEARDTARDGETVVALVDDTEATLKRIEQRPDRCLLHPANPAFPVQSYPPDRVRIQGVVVGLMRAHR